MAGAIEAGSTDCTEVVEEVESSEGHSVVQACTGLDQSSTAVVGGAVRNYVRMGIVAEPHRFVETLSHSARKINTFFTLLMSAFSFQFYSINNETLFSLKYILNVLLPRLRISHVFCF